MSYKALVDGFYTFKDCYFNSEKSVEYKKLVEGGQKPDVLVISCSDSRVDPAILTDSEQGKFFAIRNVAALVPPYNNGGKLRGTSSAIEFAVRFLNVKHIIVLGHEKCGGVNALYTGDYKATDRHDFEFLGDWLDIGRDARERVFNGLGDCCDTKKIRALEQATIIKSVANLLTFPWIKSKYDTGEVKIHGWYFDMTKGDLLEYNADKKEFCNIEGNAEAEAIDEDLCLTDFVNQYKKKCNC